MKVIADAYCLEADPQAHHWALTKTFQQFDTRVAAFCSTLPSQPDRTVLFGHDICFKLLCWKLKGFNSEGLAGIRTLRQFQSRIPMPNCAVYSLHRHGLGKWCLKRRVPSKMGTAAEQHLRHGRLTQQLLR